MTREELLKYGEELESEISGEKLISTLMNCSRNGGFCSNYRAAIAMPEKGINSKMESKYSVRIKMYGNGVADDGYKWRKYGQKSIKNSPNPRSYYRCTNPKCNAKRQVERSTEDPNILIITYEGLHLHYTYSHFLHSQTNQLSSTKKPKTNTDPVQPTNPLLDQEHQTPSIDHPLTITDQDYYHHDVEKFGKVSAMREEIILQEEDQYNNNNNNNNNGLLEDIVPLMVRKPCSPTRKICNSNEVCYNMYNCPSQMQASSPNSYSSSICWTPETFHFAESVLSSIV